MAICEKMSPVGHSRDVIDETICPEMWLEDLAKDSKMSQPEEIGNGSHAFLNVLKLAKVSLLTQKMSRFSLLCGQICY